MSEVFQNIFFQYLGWQFFDVPKKLIKVWKNFLLFNLNYFSIPLLIKTLFAPWRKYKVSYGRGFDIGKYFEALLSNLIFRILGAIIRIFLIIIGLFLEVLIIFAGIAVFLGWIAGPVILIYGLIFGFKVLF